MAKKRQFFVSANGGRISVRFLPVTLTMGFRFSNVTALRNFWKLISRLTTSDKSHFGRKRRFCVCANGGRISARFAPPCNYEGSILQFYGFTELLKLISRIAPSDVPHFGRKRQFCASANGGRISVRFSPTTITRGFRFPILRLCGALGR